MPRIRNLVSLEFRLNVDQRWNAKTEIRKYKLCYVSSHNLQLHYMLVM